MTSTKILSIALIVFLAGVGLSASISGALLKLTEIAGLEKKIAGDLEKSLTTINRFYCGGISYGDSLVGVSFSFFTGEEQPLTRDGIKDTTRDLASRSVAIPFLRQLSRVQSERNNKPLLSALLFEKPAYFSLQYRAHTSGFQRRMGWYDRDREAKQSRYPA
ncbi:MAG TPA: hypothetical protein PLD15_12895 [Mesotoga sp.]|nr:hypothetical protein [Mesotoga sp.]